MGAGLLTGLCRSDFPVTPGITGKNLILTSKTHHSVPIIPIKSIPCAKNMSSSGRRQTGKQIGVTGYYPGIGEEPS